MRTARREIAKTIALVWGIVAGVGFAIGWTLELLWHRHQEGRK